MDMAFAKEMPRIRHVFLYINKWSVLLIVSYKVLALLWPYRRFSNKKNLLIKLKKQHRYLLFVCNKQ